MIWILLASFAFGDSVVPSFKEGTAVGKPLPDLPGKGTKGTPVCTVDIQPGATPVVAGCDEAVATLVSDSLGRWHWDDKDVAHHVTVAFAPSVAKKVAS